jgi:hypothetical protein
MLGGTNSPGLLIDQYVGWKHSYFFCESETLIFVVNSILKSIGSKANTSLNRVYEF